MRNVEVVFKDGVAYDPDLLIASVAGTVGGFDVARLVRWPLNLLIVSCALFIGAICGAECGAPRVLTIDQAVKKSSANRHRHDAHLSSIGPHGGSSRCLWTQPIGSNSLGT